MLKPIRPKCFFWSQILFTYIIACPFTNYEDSLISPLNPINIETQNLGLDTSMDGDSIAFGYWSFCIPLWEVKRYPTVEYEYDIYGWQQGQLLFFVKSLDNVKPIMLGYISFDSDNLQVVHSIVVHIQESFFVETNSQYSTAIYEGKWIFTLVTFVPQSQIVIIEMTDQSTQIIVTDLSSLSNLQITIGGRGLIIMNQMYYNLNIFRGRLSKLIFEPQFSYDPNKFIELSNKCQIPQKIIGEQIINIVPGLRQFNGDALLQFVIDQVGNRYCLSGWVKYDASQTVYQSKYTLLRLTAFKNYQNNLNFGDNLFYMYVSLYRSYPPLTTLYTYTNPYSIPLLGPIDFNIYNELNIQSSINFDTSNDHYFYGLQQWHFVQYEYGRTGEGEPRFLLQIQFFNEIGLITYHFGSPRRVASFTNSNFYLFFGGDDDSLELLRASIYDFKFEYNYNENKYFMLNVCHYTCFQCNGPLRNNCISCSSSSERIFLEELQICKCKQNYIDYEGQMICQQFSQDYKSITESEIQTEFASQCQSGYFSLSNKECIQCPQQNFNDQLCVDCLHHPLTWFKKPKCTLDLVSRKIFSDDAYTLVERKEIDYDLYIVEEAKNIFLLEGAVDFCDDFTVSGCHQTNYLHLGIQVSIICKENYYFSQSQCLKPDPQCLKSDSIGQCIQCLDGLYLKNNHCLECPLNCQTCRYDQSLICESCYQRYTLSNGECVECGSYCQICKYFFDELLNSSYLRCYKCIDDSKYMFSFDGKNCLLNPIPNCNYAFQTLSSDITVNTLDYYFQPRDDSYNIINFCGQCERTYIFVLQTLECMKGFLEICDFGYAYSRDFDYYSQICLVSQFSWDPVIIQYNDQCESKSQNCETCLLGKPAKYTNYITCLICKAGYYSERLSGKCYQCPEQLNCYQCIQQDSFSKDRWKVNIRAFYRQFIEGDYQHPFIIYGQSQNPNDYEVICSMCQSGYELYNNKCILSCPQSCLECQLINQQNICVKCQLEQYGRRLSLINNQCIQCPINCALCRQRSIQEIIQINPLFNNLDYQLYTYQCLKSFNNINYYYDQEIGQFIQCNDQGCQKQFIIPIQLYCSQDDYNNQLSLQLTDQEIKQFKRQNILITDLFSGNSFKEFYNKEFYLMMNEKQIKKVIIKIEEYRSQTCQLSGASILTQNFSANVFSAIDVELEMQFFENSILTYDQTIEFDNFQKISIKGLNLQSQNNYRLKQVIFRSSWSQIIVLNNIIYKQEAESDQSQIVFKNLKQLSIDNLELVNLVQSDINNFFLIEKTDNTKNIFFNQIKILNCILSNQIMFLFNLGLDDTVTIQNIEIQSTFVNSSLISSLDSIQMAHLKLSQFSFLGQIKDCIKFLDIYRFKDIEIEKVELKFSGIVNSTFIYLNNFASLSHIQIKDSKFTIASSIIINSDQLLDNSISIYCINITFSKNIYDEFTKFIQFKKFRSKTSEINFNQLYLVGNSAEQITEEFNSDQIDSALVYIQFSIIQIIGLEIQRGYGLIDISIAEAQKLMLEKTTITQYPDFIFLGLHQYLDCQMKQIKGQSYRQSFYIFQTKQIEIMDLKIIGIEIFNQPLIIIKSADLGIIQQIESIKIKNIFAKSNLLLLNQLTKLTTLFMFQSSQDINLTIINAQFQDNLLHEYVQNQRTDSGTLFYVDFTKGQFTIKNSLFYNNLVTNSSDSIFHISSNEILIQNCQFTNNSIFKYETLAPYLFWGFPSSQKIHLSIIESIFPVESKSGNGLLRGETIRISETNITNSSGSFGGGFHITAQNQAIISLENCKFNNIDSLFKEQDESGGVIYFDGSNAQSFTLKIENISASNINCRYKGGLLYILAGVSQANIQLNRIFANDVYSSLGSLLFLEFSNLAVSSQNLLIQGLSLENNQQNQIHFLNKFTNLYSQEQNILLNNRSVIYVNYGDQLVFKNITMQNLLFESAFQLSNAKKISIHAFSITNCSLNKNLINIVANSLSESYYIIREFTAFDSQIGQAFPFIQCPTPVARSKNQAYFQCFSQVESAPQHLDEERNFIQDGCVINNFNTQYDLANSGLILFSELTQSSQLKLDQINLKNINCQNCQKGLISAIYSQADSTLPKIILESITISHSYCGTLSCLIFINGQISRILQESQIYQLGYELIINRYNCINNTAVNGTCLIISNLKSLIKKSNFIGNHATNSGGSLYVNGNKLLIIEETIISNNTAYQGGGYFLDQLMLNLTNLKSKIESNQATFYGDDLVSSATKMTVNFNGNILSTLSISKSDQIIDQVQIEPYDVIQNQIKNVLYLPTGQELHNYEYYDWKKSKYIPLNWYLRLIALNQENKVQKKLSDTLCSIKSRLLNLTNKFEEPFLNNFTNVQKIMFNETTQDYNLDNLIIYFDPETSIDIVLQLQFECNSIKIPIYNQEFPYNILDYHQNYYLLLNIRSLACQLGEIKQNNSCILCDSNQGLFSIQPNAQKCSVLDDVSTISVRPAQLNIKQKYWRPYLDTSEVSYCLNLPENCFGGWIEGDNSCYIGHIGALCEQCDLYNTRGNGAYSISKFYTCGTCENMERNIMLIVLISIWTLITILISVKSTLKTIQQCIRINTFFLFRIIVNQAAILIKMLTNFLQILATISTFQLSIPIGIDNTIGAAGNPIQTMGYSLDCMLIYIFNFEIHYSRMIWHMILPFIYIQLFLFGYFIGVKFRLFEFHASVHTTTLMYMYIYLQPNLVGGLVQLISFRKISGFQWIQANVSFRYDTSYHMRWVLEFCFPSLLLISLVIPLLMFKGLYDRRLKLNDKSTRLRWGYLYNEYKSQAYFWEIVKIIEKELIIIFLTYYQDNIVIKGILIQIIVLIYYLLNKKYQPYSSKQLNILDAYSALICTISIALGIGLYISQVSGLLELYIPFFFLISVINILFLFTIISRILMEYFREGNFLNEKKLDSLRDKIRYMFPYLQSIPFLKRVLENRTQQRKKVALLYKKLKYFLLFQAKQILAFKEFQMETLLIEPYSLGTVRETTERQGFLRTHNRISTLNNRKSISTYMQEKIKLNRIDQMGNLSKA